MTQNISFKSTFRPVNKYEFARISNKIDKKFYVDYPWTIKESVKASKAKTKDIFDCSVLGITDGKDVLLMHLCPSMPENLDFNKIKNFIMKKIKIDNPDLQAVLIGSQFNWKQSKALNDFLLGLVNKWNIPCSVFNSSQNPVNVAYFSDTDEWVINSGNIDKAMMNRETDSEKMFKSEFKTVELSSLDEFA